MFRPIRLLTFAMLLLTGCATVPEAVFTATPTGFQPAPATAAPSETAAATSTPEPTPTSVPAEIPGAESVAWVEVAREFKRPVYLTHAGDERLFIVEQPGLIWILQDGERVPEPFLDIQDRVMDQGNEQGLLGLAFHPDYPTNGTFYVNYTGAGGATHIARFQVSADPRRADPTSETPVLIFDQPYPNHNGGALVFGPDGMLYIGAGDGGSGGDPQGNGQRLDTLLGKILRLDVSQELPYAIPADNPFASGGGRGEIWAYGLRNPWRIAFDPATGDLYIGDVGQNSVEEINFQPAGAAGARNYGWNLREGSQAYAGGAAEGLVDPIAEYDHTSGCSVTGGVVIRDPRLPAWAGVYSYGDYCSGRVWALRQDGQGGWLRSELGRTPWRISSFGVDLAGRVYLLDLNGSIQRLDAAP
jgi:glucose/arabinose dehydrogenase